MEVKEQIKRTKSANDLPRAKSAKELQTMKFKTWPFIGKWKEFLGTPETSGCWIIWGNSFNGKTSFVLQLCKYLTEFESIVYNDLEEGWCQDTQDAVKAAGLDEVGGKFLHLHKEPLDLLIKRLKKHKSPNVVVINSLQYAEMTLKSYIELRSMFPKKLFILISHAEGKMPEGRVARRIRYDCAKKIRVEGFRAIAQVRGKGLAHFDIWPEEAAKYWNELQ
ncbi:hypothetical protein [Pedobacter sp.]|uniref:hypothetical protein n=1 Tax=Pedobacter sp. TaxID=1411316 RepID=UPI00396CD088